ncbi:uncharacterized protein LOC132200965 [Neocloeon triangulifer]|uniref:uncharacterized protein LOC132200965 n=1 Tax=Neocloeon triangulifer TaxID=2078957 RepID=UPI00286FAAFB|nr:uncharacterized protein LOC132200965 [Neocloeon triangulifer]
MQAFLQPTLLFLTSLAHQSMTGDAQAVYPSSPSPSYQNYPVYANNPYAAALSQQTYYQPQRAYAPAYMSRVPLRRPARFRQPAMQPFYYDPRPARPLYSAPVSPYSYYPAAGQQPIGQMAQLVLINAATAQSLAQNPHRQIFVMLQPQSFMQPQAFMQPQQPQTQVVSRAVPQSQLLQAHHQTQTIVGHPQQADPSAFTVGASYSYQNQEMGKAVGHGKK